jgi:3-oxoacyl-[acyl-carrier-protein] synthase-3
MSLFSLYDILVRGISIAVPKDAEDNLKLDLIPEAQRHSFIETTGIRYRRLAPLGLTSTDLCAHAAERLLNQMNWQAEDIDVCILVTQTPDYTIPNSASILHRKLGLSKTCISFDINLGCSGYVYGLSVIVIYFA